MLRPVAIVAILRVLALVCRPELRQQPARSKTEDSDEGPFPPQRWRPPGDGGAAGDGGDLVLCQRARQDRRHASGEQDVLGNPREEACQQKQ